MPVTLPEPWARNQMRTREMAALVIARSALRHLAQSAEGADDRARAADTLAKIAVILGERPEGGGRGMDR